MRAWVVDKPGPIDLTRSAQARDLALELGVAGVAEADGSPPNCSTRPFFLFAPVGTLVLPALGAPDRGGTLAIAGIHLSGIPPLHYQEHLFEERTLQRVTAHTSQDGEGVSRVGGPDPGARHHHPLWPGPGRRSAP